MTIGGSARGREGPGAEAGAATGAEGGDRDGAVRRAEAADAPHGAPDDAAWPGHGVAGDADAAMFTLNVRLPAGPQDAPVVEFAEIVRRTFRHRLSFTPAQTLRDALAPALAAEAELLLATLPPGGPHRIRPAAEPLALPGLMLGRLTVVVCAPDADGARVAALSFGDFVGGIQNAFAARTYFDRPTLEPREELGVRALEDVVTPILNMATAIRGAPGLLRNGTGAAARLDAQIEAIEERAYELEYQASLLRRYVGECAPERTRFAEATAPRVLRAAEPPAPALRPR